MRMFCGMTASLVLACLLVLSTLAVAQDANDKSAENPGAAKKSADIKSADIKRQESPENKGQQFKRNDAKDNVNKGDSERPAVRKSAEMAAFSPAREAAARQFVEQHHPELAPILDSLKSASPQEYRKAVIELFRNSEHLSSAKERDEERYDLELALWKVNSRIRLLLARMTMSAESAAEREKQLAEREKELRTALEEQINLQIRVQEMELVRTKARMEKLQAGIDSLQRSRDEQINKMLRQLTSSTQSRQKFRKDAAVKGATTPTVDAVKDNKPTRPKTENTEK